MSDIATATTDETIHAAAQRLGPSVVAQRRDFHRHPELAFEETRTAGIVAERLRDLGLEVRAGIGGTGVVALLDGALDGPTVLARADMDALPIHETRDTPYRSTVEGKMHACGHDGHTAVLLGVAELLAARRDRLAGRVAFVFQPAEEVVGGAKAMIEGGALDGLEPVAAIGLHLDSVHPTGTVSVREGPMMAASDAFTAHVRGSGGHAARPHQTVDPIVAAAHAVTALQSLVARGVDPVGTAVVSVTSIQGGTAHNVIPDVVELKGTLRTFDPEVRSELRERVAAVIRTVAESHRAEGETDWLFGSPALVNDPERTERLRAVARGVDGIDRVIERDAMMGGEDMALWLQRAPGCFFFVGARDEAAGIDRPHHHPEFDIDERALPLAVELLAAGILDALEAEVRAR